MKDFFDLTQEEFLDAVEAEVIRLGTEYPDAVYVKAVPNRACQYDAGTAGPGIGCIFGQALRSIGCPEAVLSTPSGIRALVGSIFWRVLNLEPLAREFDEKLWRWERVQASQDRGRIWGEAIKHITEEVPTPA